MGYTTEFRGAITIDPPLSEREVEFLHAFAEERHGGNTEVHRGYPGFWCQWVPTADGTLLVWDGSEKFYDSEKWMKFLIDEFIGPKPRFSGMHGLFTGHQLNGVIEAQGEEIADHWFLIVEDSIVYRANAIVQAGARKKI